MRTLTRWTLLVTVMVSCVGCDQVTKELASRNLRGRAPVRLIGSTVQLVYAENPGGFLSFGANLPAPLRSTIFLAFSAIAVGAMLVVAIAGRSLTVPQVLGIALFAAGGVGNLIDRITRGAARDFLFVRLGPLQTGVFNVADMAILAGLVALVVGSTSGRFTCKRPTSGVPRLE